MNVFLAILRGLKFPLKLLVGLPRKRQKKRTELEQKQLKHVRNFTPIHYSWQKRIGRDKKKRSKKSKKRKFSVKSNNSSI